MEFFIKKNATLPVLKINVFKDGRSDYDRSMKFLNETEIFFSMVNTDTGIPKITNKVARYKGQFMLRNETGFLNLPLNQEIYINVTDSFVLDDKEFQSCYVVDFPCCKSGTLLPPPPRPVTTTTTIIYTTTTTTV